MMPAVTAPTASRSSRPAAPTGEAQRAALLADLLREQILLGHAVNGGGEVGAKIEEAARRADRRRRDRR